MESRSAPALDSGNTSSNPAEDDDVEGDGNYKTTDFLDGTRSPLRSAQDDSLRFPAGASPSSSFSSRAFRPPRRGHWWRPRQENGNAQQEVEDWSGDHAGKGGASKTKENKSKGSGKNKSKGSRARRGKGEGKAKAGKKNSSPGREPSTLTSASTLMWDHSHNSSDLYSRPVVELASPKSPRPDADAVEDVDDEIASLARKFEAVVEITAPGAGAAASSSTVTRTRQESASDPPAPQAHQNKGGSDADSRPRDAAEQTESHQDTAVSGRMQRPESTAIPARRMILSSLGIRLTPEQRTEERQFWNRREKGKGSSNKNQGPAKPESSEARIPTASRPSAPENSSTIVSAEAIGTSSPSGAEETL